MSPCDRLYLIYLLCINRMLISLTSSWNGQTVTHHCGLTTSSREIYQLFNLRISVILTPVLHLLCSCTISLATVPLDFAVYLFVFQSDYLAINCSVFSCNLGIPVAWLLELCQDHAYLSYCFVLDFSLKLNHARVVFTQDVD